MKYSKKYLIFGSLTLCGILLYSFHNSKIESSDYQAYIIAKENIKKGESLSFENTDVVFMNLGRSASFFLKNHEFEDYIDFQLDREIHEFEPILKNSLVDFNSIESNIPEGQRLFMLDVSLGPIVSILKRNDVIDVIAHINIPNIGNVTETVLDGIKIIGIGNSAETFEKGENNNRYLSFYLNPEEVKIITFMKQYGEFSVVLRNAVDQTHEKTRAITLNNFLQNEKIKKILDSESFRVINGKTIRTVSFK